MPLKVLDVSKALASHDPNVRSSKEVHRMQFVLVVEVTAYPETDDYTYSDVVMQVAEALTEDVQQDGYYGQIASGGEYIVESAQVFPFELESKEQEDTVDVSPPVADDDEEPDGGSCSVVTTKAHYLRSMTEVLDAFAPTA